MVPEVQVATVTDPAVVGSVEDLEAVVVVVASGTTAVHHLHLLDAMVIGVLPDDAVQAMNGAVAARRLVRGRVRGQCPGREAHPVGGVAILGARRARVALEATLARCPRVLCASD